MKDPAFLFYSNDFLTGTFLMTDEQIGRYIKLLCLQHQKGHLKEKDMLNICKEYDEDIFSKFIQDEQGNYYNKRLEEEAEKRNKFTESRRNNLKKSHMKSHMEKHMNSHMENENINENINEIENENKIVKITSKKNFKYNNVIDIYNTYCTNLPKMQKLTEKRKTNINKLLKEITEEQFKEICIIANNSDFLIGDNDRNWKADFDFIIRPDKAVSILEGKYSNKKRDKMDDFINLWEEAKIQDEQTGNSANNNTFSW